VPRSNWGGAPASEAWIGEDNPVRVIDVFVDELDLAELTFSSPKPDMCPIRLATNVPEEQASHSLHCRHRGAAADPGPLIRRPLLEIRAVKSSILERNVLRIGDVFAL
jgi:hypothetical protein